MKLLAAFSNYVQNDLVVRPEIKTPADLKGKRIGVTSIGGTGWMLEKSRFLDQALGAKTVSR